MAKYFLFFVKKIYIYMKILRLPFNEWQKKARGVTIETIPKKKLWWQKTTWRSELYLWYACASFKNSIAKSINDGQSTAKRTSRIVRKTTPEKIFGDKKKSKRIKNPPFQYLLYYKQKAHFFLQFFSAFSVDIFMRFWMNE